MTGCFAEAIAMAGTTRSMEEMGGRLVMMVMMVERAERARRTTEAPVAGCPGLGWRTETHTVRERAEPGGRDGWRVTGAAARGW